MREYVSHMAFFAIQAAQVNLAFIELVLIDNPECF